MCAQLYVQRNAQPDTWVMSGAPTATTVFLSLAATINYSDGTSDSLPANTLAVLPDATTVFDRTHDVYVCYTVQTSGVLSVIKESLLPTLTSAYAPLCRIELHGIKPYQPEPYLASGGAGTAAPTTVTLQSSTAARAHSLWNGSSNNAPPAGWQTGGFDDSAWAPAVVADLGGGSTGISGATPLWSSTTPVALGEYCLVRQRVTLPVGVISAAAITFYTDDEGIVYVNGTAVGSDTTVGPSGPTTVTLAPSLLTAGAANLIAIYGQDTPFPGTTLPDDRASVTFSLAVTYPGAGDVVAVSGAAEGDLAYYHDGAWQRLPIGATGQELTVVSGDPAWATPPSATSGTVTSVAFAGPTGTSVSGSPITSSGTITLSWASQSANTFLGAPNGSSGAPTFRALVAADVPNLPASQITSGQLAAARGGTGLDGSGATSGQLLIGNGSGYTLATLTAGSGVTVTNSSGGISIAATGSGGTVTSVALSMPGIFSVSGSPISTSGTLAVTLATETANTVFAGPASGSAAAPTFRAVQPADLPTAPTAGGHIHAHGHFL